MRRIVFAAMTACLLVTGGWAAAQQTTQFRAPVVPEDVRTGADIGFRIYEVKNGRALGVLVVRTKDGAWVEAHPVPGRGYVVPVDRN
jgi:hypothetical protein